MINIKLLNVILILILNILITTVKSSEFVLPENENNAAISLLTNFVGVTTTDPCGETKYFSCSTDNGTSFINTIYMYQFIGSVKTIGFGELSEFTKVSIITISFGFKLNSNFISNLNDYTRLKLLFISSFNGEIDEYFNIPQTLNYLKVDSFNTNFGAQWFNSSITKIEITAIGVGYSMVNELPLNCISKLQDFTVIATQENPLPLNFGTIVTDLIYLKLTIDNSPPVVVLDNLISTTSSNSSNYLFPDLTGSKISTLLILFKSKGEPSSLSLEFPSNIESLENLDYLSISNYGFNISSKNFIDLTKTKSTKFLLEFIGKGNIIEQCAVKPCLKFVAGSRLRFIGSNPNFNNIDLLNLRSLLFAQNQLTINQSLPTELSYSITTITVYNTNINGSIPQEYCQIPSIDQLSIYNNQFTELPGCFRCLGGKILDGVLLPNQFSDFNATSEPDCSSFYINPEILIAKTDGSSNFTIQGKDFGWSIEPFESIGPIVSIVTPNKLLNMSVPVGEGSLNKYQFYFNGNQTTNFTFSIKYEKPIITSYDLIEIGGLKQFVINGTGFSWVNSNKVYINSKLYIASIATSLSNGTISIPLNSINNINGSFNIYIDVGDQNSDIITFKSDIISSSSSENSKSSDDVSSSFKLYASVITTFIFITLSLFNI